MPVDIGNSTIMRVENMLYRGVPTQEQVPDQAVGRLVRVCAVSIREKGGGGRTAFHLRLKRCILDTIGMSDTIVMNVQLGPHGDVSDAAN